MNNQAGRENVGDLLQKSVIVEITVRQAGSARNMIERVPFGHVQNCRRAVSFEKAGSGLWKRYGKGASLARPAIHRDIASVSTCNCTGQTEA